MPKAKIVQYRCNRDRIEMLRLRRIEQCSRVPTNPLAQWAKLNTKRKALGLKPAKMPRQYRSKYPGYILRSIRARTHNFLGEPQR